jgi:hypothetical protein
MTSLTISPDLVQQLAWYDDGDIDEQKAVEKYLRVIPKKYTRIALSMETLLDLSTLSIEEVTGRLKAVDDREEEPPTNPISANGKLLFTEEQWLTCQKEKKKQVGSSSSKDHCRQPCKKSSNDDGTDGGGGKGGGGGGGEHKVTRDNTCLNCGHRVHWAKDCRQPKHGGAVHMAQAKEQEEHALFLAHASPVLRSKGETDEGEALPSPHTHSTPSLTSSALLHIDEPCVQAFLGDGSDDDKLEGWYLDNGATHHMTGCIGHFADLDCSVQGSVKFADESTVEICGIRSVVFMGKTGEHKLLHEVYYIPAL